MSIVPAPLRLLVGRVFCRLGIRGHYMVWITGGPGRCAKCARVPSLAEIRWRKWYLVSPEHDREMRSKAGLIAKKRGY